MYYINVLLVIGITYGIMKSLSPLSIVQLLGVKDSEKMASLTDFLFASGNLIFNKTQKCIFRKLERNIE